MEGTVILTKVALHFTHKAWKKEQTANESLHSKFTAEKLKFKYSEHFLVVNHQIITKSDIKITYCKHMSMDVTTHIHREREIAHYLHVNSRSLFPPNLKIKQKAGKVLENLNY